ncbi:MAG TPA: hypothetical protein PLK40_04510 [Bacteroidaceae bacterium]|nr:hypothetical protein [Bacteroidaceae bacterium]
MKNKNLSILCLLLFLCIPTYASWKPFIVHFEKEKYGENTHTWQMSTTIPGWLFVAAESGFLQYDGSSWQHFSLPDRSPARSVLPDFDSRRVYVGGSGVAGYFEPTVTGQMIFKDILAGHKDIANQLANIWDIYQAHDMLYLCGDNGVARITSEMSKVDFIAGPGKITASTVVEGSLYIGCQEGLFVLVGQHFIPVYGTESFQGHTVRAIIPYKNDLLLLTSDGLYRYSNQKIHPYLLNLNNMIRETGPFCAAMYRGMLAIGTVKSGVFCYDMLTNQITNVSEINGLRNNTVLSLSFDEQGFLWAGLDRGIDYILLSSPLSNLYTFPESYGSGYAAYQKDNNLYLGTNRGLYHMNYDENDLYKESQINEVAGTEGQVWGLQSVDGDLFCMHDKGLLQINGPSDIETLPIHRGCFCVLPMSGKKQMFVGHYHGMSLLNKQANGKWALNKYFNTLSGSFNQLVFYNDSTVWGVNSHILLHIRFSRDWEHISHRREYKIDSIMNTVAIPKIAVVNDTLRIISKGGIYYYNDHLDTFHEDLHLEECLEGNTYYRALDQLSNGSIWALSDQVASLYCTDDQKSSVACKYAFPLDASLDFVGGYEKLIFTQSGNLILPYDKGFAMLDVEQSKQQRKQALVVYIDELAISATNDSIVYKHHMGKSFSKPHISWSNNVLRFVFGVNRIESRNDVLYRYRFTSKEDWSPWSKRNTKEFAGLYENDYTLHLQAKTVSGDVAETSFHFTILPPWWRKRISYVVYVVFGLFVMVGFVYLDQKRVKKQFKRAEEEAQVQIQEQKEIYKQKQEQQEEHIAELEKENLKYELSYKQQEVTNLLLSSAKQNELLEEIKNDLMRVQSAVRPGNIRELRGRLEKLTNRIDVNMQNQEVLERVEKEFNMLHNSMMTKLKANYPDLNQNERMMCIYIRMHLLTKEIAPLLNLSVRGIETLRYRLRKKFNLNREESLSSFLKELENKEEKLY